LERCTQWLRHRGPDDTGYFVGDGIGLVASRLSIIDLAGGHQPLSDEDGAIWIAYNGEVVNAPDLRAELQAAGHRFRTRADTEVIVHAYEQWGDAAVTRLRGMFAFGLWDGNRRRLLLARDRLGIKPLYYAQAGSRFAFASEIRPLLAALPSLSRRANLHALRHLFAVGFMPAPQTAFQDIYKLPAAHTLVVADGGAAAGIVEVRPYWELSIPHDGDHLRLSPDEAAAQFMAHLRDAVAAWRLSDVPVGSLLSGGVDSAALAALLTEISGPIHTFHISFAPSAYDESSFAQMTAEAIGSHHHTLPFTESAFDLLPQVVRHLEEPQCSATSVPIYLLYKACREAGFKAILTGEGADELLGGYHWFDGDRRVRPFLLLPRLLRRQLARLPLHVSQAGRRVLAQGTRDPRQRYALWQQVAPPEMIDQLLENGGPDDLQTLLPHGHGRHPFDQFLLLESQTRMVDFINFEVDRMSMANSVEARPPFLDHRLWEFCARLPPDLKLTRVMNKAVLRQGMADLLPAAVRHRPKQGLASPHAAWWRREQLPAWAEECLHPSALVETGYFNPAVAGRLREEHRNGRADHSRILMGILTTQLWHQEMEIEDA